MPLGSQGGTKGKPKATIDPVFTGRLRELREQAKNLHNAHQGKAQRNWQIPEDMTTSLLDIKNLHMPAFDREELNNQYAEVTKDADNAGTIGDVISIKMQLDYNAMEERAFRARHTTFCRSMCLGQGRRYGQGHGAVWSPTQGIEAEAAAFLAAGGATTSGE